MIKNSNDKATKSRSNEKKLKIKQKFMIKNEGKERVEK